MSGSRAWLFLWVLLCLVFVNFSTPLSEYSSAEDPKIVINSTNYTHCILASLNVSLTVVNKAEGNRTVLANIPLPSDVDFNGFCDNKEFQLNFEWPSRPNNTQENNELNITWAKITGGSRLKSVVFKIFPKEFGNVSPDESQSQYFTFYLPQTFPPLADGSIFQCSSGKYFQDASTRNAFWISGKYQLGDLKNNEFPQESQICEEDEPREQEPSSPSESSSSDTVSAIVGGVLATLVVLTLLLGFGLHYYGTFKK